MSFIDRLIKLNLVHKYSDQKKYLFVGGCARSGTSAITKVIGNHREIVLGMERYNNLCEKDNFSLSKEHFVKERFFNIQDSDTFYTDFNRFHYWFPDIYKKFDNSVYVGIKYTDIHEIIEELKFVFGEIKIIYIYRNIYDVAESWNKRAIRGNDWPPYKDYIQAVDTWNRSLEIIKSKKEEGCNIYCVNYEDLFFTRKSVDVIFKSIDLRVDKNVKKTLLSLRTNAPIFRSRKEALNENEIEYIKKNARFELYDFFNNNFNLLK